MMRKMHLGKCLLEGDWEAVRNDLKRRPLNSVSDTSPTGEIMEALNRQGIFAGRVELWGTGQPLREFLWSEDMPTPPSISWRR